MNEHKKRDGSAQGVKWKNSLLQEDEWKVVGCKWPLGRRCVLVKKEYTTTYLYCGKCEGIFEGRGSVDSASASSASEEGGAAEESGFEGQHSEVETAQYRCGLICSEDLHLTPSKCEQNPQLGH